MNNISANHSKYVLMSNATTDSHNEKFSLMTSDLNIRRSIIISPLKKNESFRFLGIWFNIEHSNRFVVQQITTEYNRFVNLLSSKMLTDKQLIYLHNSVLIPMVKYKMQVTPFTEVQCNSVVRKYRMLLKKKLSLIKSMPNIALHDTHGYNLVDLFAHQQQCQIATLTHLLNSYSKAGDIYRLRMKILQQDLWIPFSPIGITDWSPWIKSPYFIHDIIARSLHMAATLNISFNKHSQNDLLVKGGSIPLIHILKETYHKASGT